MTLPNNLLIFVRPFHRLIVYHRLLRHPDPALLFSLFDLILVPPRAFLDNMLRTARNR